MANGLRLFDRLGVYQEMLARGFSIQTATLHSMRGHVLGHQKITDDELEQTQGYGYLRIKRTDILDTLLAAATKADIPVHYGKSLTSITETDSSVTVHFADGTSDTSDVLFGCDGIHSAVRTAYVDPDQKPEYFGFAGLGSLVSTKDLSIPKLTGLNAMLTTHGTILSMPCSADGDQVQWGFQRETPLPDSSDARDGWEIKKEEQVAEFKVHLFDVLRDAQGGWGHTLREIVDKSTVLSMYPVYRLAAGGAWSKGRCLLLGDAAHATPPQAGQGLSMAIEDVFLIAKLLASDKRALQDAFATYDAIRRPRVEQVAKLAVKNAEVRRQSSPAGLFIKETLIWAFFSLKSMLHLPNWGVDKDVLHYDVEDEKFEL